MSRIRIALVDDHPVVLAGIRALLQNMPESSSSARRVRAQRA